MTNGLSVISKIINEVLDKIPQARILDVGCGFTNWININERHWIVGIDLSEKQLDRNTYVDEKIVGDIQTYDFAPASFDLVFCWDVLEHLNHPKDVLTNMNKSIRSGGLVVLKIPNILSLKGLITKVTPLWFHILIKRILLGYSDAGKDDHGPFKTYMKWFIRPRQLIKWYTENGLALLYFELYDAQFHGSRGRVFIAFYHVCSILVKVLTFGLLKKSECLLLFRKNDLALMNE